MGSLSQNRSTQKRLKRKHRASKAKLRKNLGKCVRFWVENQSQQVQGILKTASMTALGNGKAARRRLEVSAPSEEVHNQTDLKYTALPDSDLSFANRQVQIHKHKLASHKTESLGSHPTTPLEGEFTTQDKDLCTNRHDGDQDGGDSKDGDGGNTTTRDLCPRPSEETSDPFCEANSSVKVLQSDMSDISSQATCSWMPTSAEANSDAPHAAHASKCNNHSQLLSNLASQQRQLAELRGTVDHLRGENSELRKVVNGVRWEAEEYLGGPPMSGQQALFQVQDMRKRCCWYEEYLPGLRESVDAGLARLDALTRKKVKTMTRSKVKFKESAVAMGSGGPANSARKRKLSEENKRKIEAWNKMYCDN